MYDVRKKFHDANGEALKAFKTPFPNTFFNSTNPSNIDYAYRNERIMRVHAAIKDGRKSPYLAWAEELGFSQDHLAEFLNMHPRSVQHLLDHPNLSPPTKNVHAFCDRLGVHPAYLVPNMTDRSVICHYSILRAVAHIYKDYSLPQHERDIARDCLATEKSKFNYLILVDSYAYKNLAYAHKLIQGYLNDKDLDSVLEITSHLEKMGVTYKSGHVSRNPASDIDSGLDILRAAKITNVDNAYLAIENEDRSKLDIYYGALLDVADLLYGPEKSEDIIQETISSMMQFEGSDPMIEWEFLPNGNWLAKNDSITSELVLPNIYLEVSDSDHADIYNHEDLFRSYERGILNRLQLMQRHEHKKENAIELERDLVRFEKWRDSARAQTYHIPLLANYALAERALGQQLLLPPPEQEEAIPAPRRKHIFEHSFK